MPGLSGVQIQIPTPPETVDLDIHYAGQRTDLSQAVAIEVEVDELKHTHQLPESAPPLQHPPLQSLQRLEATQQQPQSEPEPEHQPQPPFQTQLPRQSATKPSTEPAAALDEADFAELTQTSAWLGSPRETNGAATPNARSDQAARAATGARGSQPASDLRGSLQSEPLL